MSFTIHDLEARVHQRAAEAPENSYTRKLIDRGVAHCAKKLGEEAVETVIAAIQGDRDRIVSESADVLYHLMVVLAVGGVGLDEVMRELEGRTGRSGIAEKAARS